MLRNERLHALELTWLVELGSSKYYTHIRVEGYLVLSVRAFMELAVCVSLMELAVCFRRSTVGL